MKHAVLLLALTVCPMVRDAQICAGRMRFALREMSPVTGTLDTVRFVSGDVDRSPARLTSPDGAYQVIIPADNRSLSAPTLRAFSGTGVAELDYGCSGSYDLMIARRENAGAKNDTMRIGPMEVSATYRFEIVDADGNPIRGALLNVTPDGGRLSSIHEVAPGSMDRTIAGSAAAHVVVSAAGFRSDTITLGEHPGGSRATGSIVVQLARPGDAYEYRNGRKFAYTPRPDMIAMLVYSNDAVISRLLDSLGVRAVDHGYSPFFVGRTRQPLDGMNNPVLAAIRRAPGGAEAGPIRSLSNDRIVVFSDRIRITCREGFDPRRSDLLRRMPSIGSIGPVNGGAGYIVRVAPEVGEGIVDIARDLPKIDGIISASIEYITPPRVVH